MFSGTIKCNIVKLVTDSIEISCELLDTLRRISVTVTCTHCTCYQPITVVGDSPIVVTNLVAGKYTVEMVIADTANINDTIVEIITVSDNDIPIISTIVKMITASDKCTSAMFVTPTNGPSSESMYVYSHMLCYPCIFIVHICM